MKYRMMFNPLNIGTCIGIALMERGEMLTSNKSKARLPCTQSLDTKITNSNHGNQSLQICLEKSGIRIIALVERSDNNRSKSNSFPFSLVHASHDAFKNVYTMPQYSDPYSSQQWHNSPWHWTQKELSKKILWWIIPSPNVNFIMAPWNAASRNSDVLRSAEQPELNNLRRLYTRKQSPIFKLFTENDLKFETYTRLRQKQHVK